jgi:isopenicillin N synthase-like dioxygenase
MLEYRDHVLKLASNIMMILAKGLPFDCDKAFAEFMSDPVGSVNLIHYPPRERDKPAALGGI